MQILCVPVGLLTKQHSNCLAGNIYSITGCGEFIVLEDFGDWRVIHSPLNQSDLVYVHLTEFLIGGGRTLKDCSSLGDVVKPLAHTQLVRLDGRCMARIDDPRSILKCSKRLQLAGSCDEL